MLPLIMIFLLSGIIIAERNQPRAFDWFEILILITAILGTLVTLYSGELKDLIGGNLVRLILTFSAYRVGRKYTSQEDSLKYLKSWAIFGGVGTAIGVAIIYAFGVIGGMPVYLGLGTEAINVALAYVLVRRDPKRLFWLLVVIALILGGGRRGNMLAMVGVLSMYGVFSLQMKGINMRRLTTYAVAFITCVVAVTTFNTSEIAASFIESLPKPLAARFEAWGLTGKKVDAREASAGRSDEINSVLDQFRRSPERILCGFGFDAKITLPTGEEVRTVHFTPLALVFQYGLLGIPIFAFAILLPVFCVIRGANRLEPEEMSWCLVTLSLVLLSFTIFTFFQTQALWVGAGVMMGNYRRGLKRTQRLKQEAISLSQLPAQ